EFKKSTSTPIVEEERAPVKAEAAQKESEQAVIELAKKLGISTEGKSIDQIAKEIAEVASKKSSK
ncbi:MAG: twin-arginine translocase TatA/TatE family subunit, partial [Candidatus Methanomethylicota archaeon]